MDHPNTDVYARQQNAPSVISSRMTDIVSEDGDEYHPEGAAAASTPPRQSGAPTLTSSRPASPPQTSYSRRGIINRRGGTLFAGPGLSMTNTSRPQSAYSRKSLTHASSITSQAFFRPMSSQRLQAQRRTRPGTAATPEELPRLSSSTINRPSEESARSATQRHDHPGPSPLTEFIEHDSRERALYSSSPTGNNTIPSTEESARPLHQNRHHPSRHREDQSLASKTPTSFAINFFRVSRNVPDPHPKTERPSNETSSPRPQEKVNFKAANGKNHEYFSGNTVFCWGGRLQNTRDRPVNIATGILVVLPTVLFFVYE